MEPPFRRPFLWWVPQKNPTTHRPHGRELEEQYMKNFIACFSLLVVGLSAQASETTFVDILARVTARDPITKAIQMIDNGLQFRMDIEGEQAKVTIWKNMKVRDPKEETYLFPLSNVIRHEYARLQFQGELNNLIARCAESEQRFRISQYKRHPVRVGMPYDEAKELLKDEFQADDLPRAESGAYRLESDTHSMVFRGGVLIDIITKEASNKPNAGDGK
jgi:hypothetical protein